MEEWQEMLIQEAEEKALRDKASAMEFAKSKVEKINKTLEFKKRIIEALREEPYSMFGEAEIYLKTGNHQLVHDVVKAIGVELKRTAQADGFNFVGEHEGIRICVYGMKEVPHCKIVPKTEMQPVTTYEIICNEGGEKGEES